MLKAMRHHWLLLRICHWALLILVFVGTLSFFRLVDDYGDRGVQSWTGPRPKPVKASDPVSLTSTEKKAHVFQPTLPPLDPEWHSVNEKRIELLTSMCRNSSINNLTHVSISKFVLDRIFVCDKHKILFCQTPKVGNTQWKKVLIVLNGKFPTVDDVPEKLVHDHSGNGLHRLSSLTPQEISHRLNTYFKFLIVRDPFERLISAFKDKFEQNPRDEPWYNEDIAPMIIGTYRKSYWDGVLTPSELHFEEFVHYLVDVGVRRRILDQLFTNRIIHWMTYTELCAPCEIQYSAVGHHETLEKDAPYILHAAGVEGLVSYPGFPPDITRYNRTKVEQYFSGISKQDIRRLFARYQSDFHLFGYPRPDFLLN
ncbi:carbohydrate sulfotransferase 10-like [Salarias fasciatus]|uniref:carbohydrate sulfotransferase 10-like n=1 Tax=Salarias fasciatus TaxID=181472 RepID=UPI0011770356|nr:carbohydrate sulfotransferase 10-like [Salarias fasciatus]